MGKKIDYPFEMRPLSAEEGGGFLISYPDFSECLSDGETIEEALANGKDALKATIAALKGKSRGGVAEYPCSHLHRRRAWTQGAARVTIRRAGRSRPLPLRAAAARSRARRFPLALSDDAGGLIGSG